MTGMLVCKNFSPLSSAPNYQSSWSRPLHQIILEYTKREQPSCRKNVVTRFSFVPIKPSVHDSRTRHIRLYLSSTNQGMNACIKSWSPIGKMLLSTTNCCSRCRHGLAIVFAAKGEAGSWTTRTSTDTTLELPNARPTESNFTSLSRSLKAAIFRIQVSSSRISPVWQHGIIKTYQGKQLVLVEIRLLTHLTTKP